MKKIVSLALAAAAAITATPANANEVQIFQDGTYRLAVPYHDLNLGSDAGLRALQGRMKAATNVVCSINQVSSLSGEREARACRQEIQEAAQPQIALAARGARRGIVVSEGN